MKTSRRIVSLIAAMLLLISLAACGSSEETAEETPKVSATMPAEPTPEPTEAPAEATPEPAQEAAELDAEPINPLTGEAAAEDMSSVRPYAVMINNHRYAQPQAGISQADMIWELMEEGGITRMMGIFTDLSDVERVGTIRSARKYNVSVAQALDAIFVHAGGSDEALNYIDEIGLADICFVRGRYSPSSTFYRDPTRQSHGIEHSLFAIGEKLIESAENYGYRENHYDGFDGTYGLSFSDTAEEQCTEPATYIQVNYAGGKTSSFFYDEDTGLYSMEQFGDTYTDDGYDNVRFKNVIVMYADTHLQSDGLHLTIDLTGSNRGYFCCGGKYVPIRWNRSGESDNFHFTLEDGTPLALGVGTTFVAVNQSGSYSGSTDFG